MHFIAYSSLWFSFLLHLDWHKLCKMVFLISAPGRQAAGWARGEGGGRGGERRNLILFKWSLWIVTVRVHVCVRARESEGVDSHLCAADRTFNKTFRWSCRHKCLPKVLTFLHWHFHCWYTYHTQHTRSSHSSSSDAGNSILIVLHSLNWLTPITCSHLQPIRVPFLNDTKDIFTPCTCCWEAFCKNCVRVGKGSYWVAVCLCVRIHMCMHVCVVWN